MLLMIGIPVGVILALLFFGDRIVQPSGNYSPGRVLNTPRPDPLLQLLRADPNFSPVLFRAFAHLVFVKYHESRGGMARHSSDDFAVAPYLNEELRKSVRESKESVREVIVGDLSIGHVTLGASETSVRVLFKANIVYRSNAGKDARMLVKQQMVFKRPRGLLTREPERVLALGCPSCGSRAEPEVSGRCLQCGTTIAGGEQDWQVVRLTGTRPEPVSGPVGESGGVEVGTNLPTVVDPGFHAEMRALKMRDPAFDWTAFRVRARAIFMKLQEGWTKRDEAVLRPYELDHVFDAHRIWLQRYREEGVRNVLEDTRIDKWEVAKISHDAWFDVIVVRIFASMIDFHETDDGKLLSGNRTRRRTFSEYFTFVRRTGAAGRKVLNPLHCPQCGAPLDNVSRLGICGYCDSRITTGEFDWVLALITQDEEYDG